MGDQLTSTREFHAKGYNFMGQGTLAYERLTHKFDKIRDKIYTRSGKEVPPYLPINILDLAAVKHDILYMSNSDDVRHQADINFIKEISGPEYDKMGMRNTANFFINLMKHAHKIGGDIKEGGFYDEPIKKLLRKNEILKDIKNGKMVQNAYDKALKRAGITFDDETGEIIIPDKEKAELEFRKIIPLVENYQHFLNTREEKIFTIDIDKQMAGKLDNKELTKLVGQKQRLREIVKALYNNNDAELKTILNVKNQTFRKYKAQIEEVLKNSDFKEYPELKEKLKRLIEEMARVHVKGGQARDRDTIDTSFIFNNVPTIAEEKPEDKKDIELTGEVLKENGLNSLRLKGDIADTEKLKKRSEEQKKDTNKLLAEIVAMDLKLPSQEHNIRKKLSAGDIDNLRAWVYNFKEHPNMGTLTTIKTLIKQYDSSSKIKFTSPIKKPEDVLKALTYIQEVEYHDGLKKIIAMAADQQGQVNINIDLSKLSKNLNELIPQDNVEFVNYQQLLEQFGLKREQDPEQAPDEPKPAIPARARGVGGKIHTLKDVLEEQKEGSFETEPTIPIIDPERNTQANVGPDVYNGLHPAPGAGEQAGQQVQDKPKIKQKSRPYPEIANYKHRHRYRQRRPFFLRLGTDLIRKSDEKIREDGDIFANFSWIPKDGNFRNPETNKIVSAMNLKNEFLNEFPYWIPQAPQQDKPLNDNQKEKIEVPLVNDIITSGRMIGQGLRANPGPIRLYPEHVQGIGPNLMGKMPNRLIFKSYADGQYM